MYRLCMSIEDAFKRAQRGKGEEELPQSRGADNVRVDSETPGKRPISLKEADEIVFKGSRKTFHVDESPVRAILRQAEDIARNKNKK